MGEETLEKRLRSQIYNAGRIAVKDISYETVHVNE